MSNQPNQPTFVVAEDRAEDEPCQASTPGCCVDHRLPRSRQLRDLVMAASYYSVHRPGTPVVLNILAPLYASREATEPEEEAAYPGDTGTLVGDVDEPSWVTVEPGGWCLIAMRVSERDLYAKVPIDGFHLLKPVSL